MGDGGQIMIIGVNIPKNPQSYEQFSEAMKSTETILLNQLANMNTGNA